MNTDKMVCFKWVMRLNYGFVKPPIAGTAFTVTDAWSVVPVVVVPASTTIPPPLSGVRSAFPDVNVNDASIFSDETPVVV